MTNENTHLKYLEHMYMLEDSATVVDSIKNENDTISIILDQTIFYPQGGGQPYDQGTITNMDNTASFNVEEVRFRDGIVYHIGTFTQGTLPLETSVMLHVNEERRTLNNRNHTAGHLIDIAMRNVGMNLIPGKAYHFPIGAYVEYSSTLDEAARETLQSKLEKEANHLVNQNLSVEVKIVSFEQLKELCSHVPDYIPTNKPSRVMIVKVYPAIPCGGTHVKNTQEIRYVTIDKIKNKKGNLRISYTIQS